MKKIVKRILIGNYAENCEFICRGEEGIINIYHNKNIAYIHRTAIQENIEPNELAADFINELKNNPELERDIFLNMTNA